jgi:hypothetical protein
MNWRFLEKELMIFCYKWRTNFFRAILRPFRTWRTYWRPRCWLPPLQRFRIRVHLVLVSRRPIKQKLIHHLRNRQQESYLCFCLAEGASTLASRLETAVTLNEIRFSLHIPSVPFCSPVYSLQTLANPDQFEGHPDYYSKCKISS